jgi:hypothetical protein
MPVPAGGEEVQVGARMGRRTLGDGGLGREGLAVAENAAYARAFAKSWSSPGPLWHKPKLITTRGNPATFPAREAAKLYGKKVTGRLNEVETPGLALVSLIRVGGISVTVTPLPHVRSAPPRAPFGLLTFSA